MMKYVQEITFAVIMSALLMQCSGFVLPCYVGKVAVRSLSTRRWEGSFNRRSTGYFSRDSRESGSPNYNPRYQDRDSKPRDRVPPLGRDDSRVTEKFDYNPRYQDTEYKPRERGESRPVRERNTDDRRSYSNYKPSYSSSSYSRDRPYHRNDRSSSSYEDRVDKEPMFGAYDGDHLYGINPIYLALQAKRRKFDRLFVQEEMKLSQKKDSKAAEAILTMAKEYGVELQYTGKHELNMLSDNRPHQGFVLRASPLPFVDIGTEIEEGREGDVILALDEVWDPQNLGALLRSAYFLGCTKVITCSKNSAPLSPPVSKASGGAMELSPIYSTRNMLKLLDRAKERGWRVMGTALTPNAVPLTTMTSASAPPTIVVLGNEGSGIRTNILRRCDVVVKVEGRGKEDAAMVEEVDDGVDSLNVSVTGGIILHYLLNA